MRIDVVDNGGQWTHREWRVLKYLDVETEIIPNTTPFEELEGRVDGLVLSGGAPRIGSEAPKLGESGSYLDRAEFPIMGICVGAQFIALHFGGKAGPAEVPEFGKAEVRFVDDEAANDPILKGITSPFQAWESHNDEVSQLPENFINLASSKDCTHQIFRHGERLIFGFQFHPEVEHTEFGADFFRNFIEICKQ